jgi:MFS family permease
MKRNTPTYVLFPIFIILNTLTLLDRAIIPGASRTFSSFCSSAYDSPLQVRISPDFGIGLLQSAFVGGYSIAIIISGHLVHRIPWRKLVASGLLIWIIATTGSGLSRTYDSYYLLLGSRMLSGVSEAAFHVVAPPMIQDRGGSRAGIWLSLYLTAIPVGLALGYIYGSSMDFFTRVEKL